jgi:uncharacterized membrane protein
MKQRLLLTNTSHRLGTLVLLVVSLGHLSSAQTAVTMSKLYRLNVNGTHRMMSIDPATEACTSETCPSEGPMFYVPSSANAGHHFISFDFPGAIDTQATAITPTGEIVGRYTSADGMQHGFLLRAGQFTSIDFPDATLTDVSWINPNGQIVGGYHGPDNIMHGFLLSGGQFTTIDCPGAQSTVAYGISSTGDIVGVETDAAGVLHGFLLRGGNFSVIDFPGAMSTLPTMIIGRHVVGGYFDSNFAAHGFLLYNHNFQTIDCPDSTSVFLSGLNLQGEMTGEVTMSDGIQHGLLVSGGKCIVVDVPGSLPGSNYANGLNSTGDMVGRYATSDGVMHAYLHRR